MTSATGHPPDSRRWKALALLCMAFFMAMLDSSIVIVALPPIDAAVGFAHGDLQWVMSAYFLGFGGLLLLGGRVADLLGARRTFVAGVGLFALASVGAGLASSPIELIAARAVQGASAAVLVPSAMSILMRTFPEGGERNRALGLWGATGAIGGTAGWLIGGVIVDGLGWQWIFYINVPVAAAVAALSPVLLARDRPAVGAKRFDVAGAVTITGALVACVYAVVQAPEAGWTDAQTLGLAGLSVLLIALFVRIESRCAAPLVPFSVFRSRGLVGGNVALFALGAMAFGVPFVITQYAQEVLGMSATTFGFAFLVAPLLVAVVSPVAQGVVTRAGPRPVVAAGLLLTGLASLALSQVSAGGSYAGDLLPGLLLLGAGIGGAYVSGSIASLSGVAESESGLASGLSNAAFQIGGAVGVAVLSSVSVAGAAGGAAQQLTNGYQSAFTVAAGFAAAGVVVAACLLRDRSPVRVAKPEAEAVAA